jgi:DNA-binding Lrp family transcriptional regulator
MISAFTLVKISSQNSLDLFKKVEKLKHIDKATLVYGEYDIVVKTCTNSIEELNNFIYNTLRKMPHVIKTTTMIIARPSHTKNKT